MTFVETSRLLRRMIEVQIVNSLAYRGNFVMYMLGTILGPVISLLIWQAAIASGASLPVSESYITSYFVLLSLVSVITSAWLSNFLAQKIRTGELSVWLARPGSFIYELAANNISEKSVKLVVLLPMVAVFGWIFRDSIDLAAPAWRWGLLLISALLGAVMFFSLDVIEGSLAFWLDEVSGIVAVRHLVMMVLAGQLVPLALMPEWSQEFLQIQPFRYLLSFPIEIVVGTMPPHEIATGLAIQCGWTVLLIVGARRIWGRGKRSYAAVGA